MEVYQTELLLAQVVSHILGPVSFETVEPRFFLLLSHDPLTPYKFSTSLLSKVVPGARVQGARVQGARVQGARVQGARVQGLGFTSISLAQFVSQSQVVTGGKLTRREMRTSIRCISKWLGMQRVESRV